MHVSLILMLIQCQLNVNLAEADPGIYRFVTAFFGSAHWAVAGAGAMLQNTSHTAHTIIIGTWDKQDILTPEFGDAGMDPYGLISFLQGCIKITW